MDSYKNKIGEKIKTLRKEHGLTQMELCEKLKTSQSLLHRWESGKKFPSMPTMIKLAKIFNISLDTLAFNERDLDTLKSKDKTFASKLNDFENLSDDDKQMVANLISSLAQKKAWLREPQPGLMPLLEPESL